MDNHTSKTNKKTQNLYTTFSIVSLFALVLASQAGAVERSVSNDKIPGDYIVVLKDNVADPDAVSLEITAKHGLSLKHAYGAALKGFAASVPQGKLAALKSDPRVQFISEDKIMTAFGSTSSAPAQVLPEGIARISAQALANKGTGIGVAVIDTGINLTHPDLEKNIIANKSCITGKKKGNDDNGHGTHVAGTIAALNNKIGVVGVAPEAKLVAVKVLNSSGSGSLSEVICGIDWVTANASRYKIKVANMSLGGGGVSDNNCGNTNADALHKAICNSRDAGVTYVVAAGNGGSDAANFVPAAYDDAVITVSALADSDGQSGGSGSATFAGADDTFASFSNYGSVVDLGAPGVDIYSTWVGGTYNTFSGTSMAAPHVAGAAALYIKSHPGSAWTQVRDGLAALGEALGAGHTDPSGLHPEPVVEAAGL